MGRTIVCVMVNWAKVVGGRKAERGNKHCLPQHVKQCSHQRKYTPVEAEAYLAAKSIDAVKHLTSLPRTMRRCLSNARFFFWHDPRFQYLNPHDGP